MSETTFKQAPGSSRNRRADLVAFLLARSLSALARGSLTIVRPDGRPIRILGKADGPRGIIALHRWRTVWRVLSGGDVGFAEAYMDGDWSSPSIASLIEMFALNQDVIPGAHGGALLSRLTQRLRHKTRANTLRGSRRNIVQHYDLGNDFYARWLDESMSYSSALFGDLSISLEAAQATKQDRVLALMDLAPGQSVLEVGIGWGGLAERVAQNGGEVTGLTLSPAQLDYARDRLARAGLGADLRLQDYREVEGSFDRIVSIEMLEAVGEARWPLYFQTLNRRLAPGGSIVLQTITIADDRFETYRSGVDFIQRHVFPGGMLPSPKALRAAVERAGLEVVHVETFGMSYAETLRRWRERFEAAWPEIASPAFPLRFKRMWEYYLAYCEGGFRSGAIDVGLWRLARRA